MKTTTETEARKPQLKSYQRNLNRAAAMLLLPLGLVLAGCASLQHNMDASRTQHLIPGQKLQLTKMRGYRFCEVALITGTSKANAIADFYNSTGSCDPTWEQFNALDAKKIARETDSRKVFLNPVRHWMFDEFWVYELGAERSFGDIKMRWMGVVPVEQLEKGVTMGHYVPGYIYRSSQFKYNKGSEVYLLDAPDGEVFVMQSFTTAVQKEVDIDHIRDLGSKLHMPPGWKFRSVVLERDLIVNQDRTDHNAHVFQDDLKDAYQGSDGGKAFNYIP